METLKDTINNIKMNDDCEHLEGIEESCRIVDKMGFDMQLAAENWIKHLKARTRDYYKNFGYDAPVSPYEHQIKWIKHFFNLED